MKLQKQLSRKVGKIVYPKWLVVIPPEKVKEAGWKEGTELEAEIKENKIILKPKK
jgi:bifunctional DNA-binding transcriptional regulator/antitoxin component of YhaV-PrlF toxin-antitoxin module